MPAINFPNSPSLNDYFESNGKAWTYNGTSWDIVQTPANLSIASGSISATELASNSVTTVKIAAGAVTAAKLGNDISLTPADGSITQAKLASTLSGITICTSSTRPASPFTGQTIFETNTGYQKIWLGSSWSNGYIHAAALNVEYLVIAGGGGGGSNHAGGGGGAGGYRNSTLGETSGATSSTETGLSLENGTHSVTVGAGGTANAVGSDSIFSSITSTGGGRGANGEGGSVSGVGGSGGGGSGVLGMNSGAAGTALQGNAGGTSPLTSTYGAGSGGGGAGSVGANSPSAGGSSGVGGNGGGGLSSSITGTAVARAGGGGGGSWNASAGTATAGGGNGADSGVGANGTANTGGGGGGCGATAGGTGRVGGTGGSGVVICRYLTANIAGRTITGGTKTTSGLYTIHTFTASGSLVIA